MTDILTPQGILDNATDFGLRLSGTDFPVSIFPQPMQHIITELHECQSFPIDYVAASMLTAIAVGIGNTHLVQVKSGWLYPLHGTCRQTRSQQKPSPVLCNEAVPHLRLSAKPSV